MAAHEGGVPVMIVTSSLYGASSASGGQERVVLPRIRGREPSDLHAQSPIRKHRPARSFTFEIEPAVVIAFAFWLITSSHGKL